MTVRSVLEHNIPKKDTIQRNVERIIWKNGINLNFTPSAEKSSNVFIEKYEEIYSKKISDLKNKLDKLLFQPNSLINSAVEETIEKISNYVGDNPANYTNKTLENAKRMAKNYLIMCIDNYTFNTLTPSTEELEALHQEIKNLENQELINAPEELKPMLLEESERLASAVDDLFFGLKSATAEIAKSLFETYDSYLDYCFTTLTRSLEQER